MRDAGDGTRVVDVVPETRLLHEAVENAARRIGLDGEGITQAVVAATEQAEHLLESVPVERREYAEAARELKVALSSERELTASSARQERRYKNRSVAVGGGALLFFYYFPGALVWSRFWTGLATLIPPLVIVGMTVAYYLVASFRGKFFSKRLSEATVESRQAESDCQLKGSRLTGALMAEIAPGFVATVTNRVLDPDYTVELKMKGVVSAFAPDSSFYTRTKEAGRLADMLQRMPGGSIGLAGPRGAGKTALIETFGSDTAVLRGSAGPYLSVAVSAPVEYDSREFILHLFATLCERVLTVSGRVLAGDSLSESAARLQLGATTSVTGSLGPVGFLGLALGSSGIAANWLAAQGGLDVNLLSATAVWALLFGLGVSIYAKVHRPAARVASGVKGIADRARSLLDGIRFQQTYTVGWGGALKLPVVETQTKNDLNLVRATRTIPDLVQEYRSFAADVAAAYGKLIVTIDEMDKIRDANSAEVFLNQLKAVFGVPRVFFLVAVSEDALVGFERRGFARRDVFDSAFDEILPVHHLDWNPARQLASRRVVGLPIPFIGLAYAVSGGLPRDLVRILRRIADMFQDRPGARIDEVAYVLCRVELAAKARATVVLLQGNASVQREISAALSDLLFESEAADEAGLREAAKRLVASISAVPEVDGQSVPQAVVELACYAYYCLTVLESFRDHRDYAVFCPSEARLGAGTVQEVVAALNELARNTAVCWERVSRCRAQLGVASWDYPLSRQMASASENVSLRVPE